MGRAGKGRNKSDDRLRKQGEEDREVKSVDLVATRMIDEDALRKGKPKRTNGQIWYTAVECAGDQREKRRYN